MRQADNVLVRIDTDTGVVGWVGGTLLGVVAGSYKFTFGPSYLPGATGYGNASNINEFWIGPDRATACLRVQQEQLRIP